MAPKCCIALRVAIGVVIATGLLCLFAAEVNGQGNSRWTGQQDNDWFNSANWTNGVPGPNTTVEITNAPNYPIISSGNISVHEVVISAWWNGGLLLLRGNAEFNTSRDFRVLGNGVLELEDQAVLNVGRHLETAFSDVTFEIVNGSINVNNTFFVNDDIFLGSSVLNAQQLNMGTGKRLNVQQAEVNTFGNMNIDGIYNGDNGITNFYGDVTVRNGGVINLDAGEINFFGEGSIENNGTLNAGDGDVIFHTDVSTQGDATLNVNDGSITFLGDVQLRNTSFLNVLGQGSVNIDGNATFQQNGNIDVGDGNLNIGGNALLRNGGTISAGDANISIQGDLTMQQNGSTFNAGSSTIEFYGGTFSNNGNFNAGESTFIFAGDGSQQMTGSNITFYNLVISDDSEVNADLNIIVLNDMDIVEEGSFFIEPGYNLNVQGNYNNNGNVNTDRPYIQHVTVNGPHLLTLIFNEPLNETADNENNYVINNGIGTAINAQRFPEPNHNIVILELGNPVQEQVEYELTMNNIENLNGQAVNPDHKKRFGYGFVEIFYSREDGDWGDISSWSFDSHSGAPANRTPGAPADSVVIGNMHTISISGSVGLSGMRPVLIQTASELLLKASGELDLANTTLSGDGTFTMQDGAVIKTASADGFWDSGNLGGIQTANRHFGESVYVFNGTIGQNTGDALERRISELRIENPDTVRAQTHITTQNLALNDGVFVMPSGSSLISGNTARNGGSLAHELEIFDIKGWRLLASPLTGTYGEWLDGITTQGFEGATFPNLQPNLLHYAETDTGTVNQSWRTISGAEDSIVPGRGHFFYVFGSIEEDNRYNDQLPAVLSISGQDPELDGTFFEFDVSFTPREREMMDAGWNLVGNPFGAAIDWDQPDWEKSGIDDVFYIWDPSLNGSGDFVAWNGVGSTSPAGSSLIAPFQGFWVKANDESPVLRVPLSARTTGGEFIQRDRPASDRQFVRFEWNDGNRVASSAITFGGDGSLEPNRRDAQKLNSPSETNVSFYSRLEKSARRNMIKHLPDESSDLIRVPFYLSGSESNHTLNPEKHLSWEGLETLPSHWNIVLMDHINKRAINLREEDPFPVSAEKGETDASTPGDFDKPVRFAERLSTILPGYQSSPENEDQMTPAGSDKTEKDKPVFTIVIDYNGAWEEPSYVPDRPSLSPNYPNPFNPVTTIPFSVPELSHVTIEIFDILGRRVQELARDSYTAGSHQLRFDGSRLSSGVFITRMVVRSAQSGAVTSTQTRKMTLIK